MLRSHATVKSPPNIWSATHKATGGYRLLSVNSAINRGLRKTSRDPDFPLRAQRKKGVNNGKVKLESGAKSSKPSKNATDETRRRKTVATSPILSIPYTTASSEFLYGTSVVQAALRAQRRKLYKLYVYDGDNRESSEENIAIRRLALQHQVVVDRVKNDRLRLMDKMSENRPHNGYVLEASPLPRTPATGLGRVQKPSASFGLSIDHQSREEAEINGKLTEIRCDSTFPRFPLVIFLDGILDAGNFGAIIRSSYFLGADALITTLHSAPLSGVALKASAGAAEYLPLLTAARPIEFLDACKNAGWNIYAAEAPGESQRPGNKMMSLSGLAAPLKLRPSILILGNESDGVREKIRKKAGNFIGIEYRRRDRESVDSLNVSAAAALVIEAFMRTSHTVDHDPTEISGENRIF